MNFVYPQAQEHLRLGEVVRRREAQALEHARDVAQVVRVVGLGGRRQQLAGHHRVQLARGDHQPVRERLHVRRELGEALEVPAHDAAEDEAHGAVLERRQAHGHEVPQQTVRHRVATTAGRTHRRHQLQIDEMVELELDHIPPTTKKNTAEKKEAVSKGKESFVRSDPIGAERECVRVRLV